MKSLRHASASGAPDNWQLITPTTEWQTMKSTLKKDKFDVATDLYYVGVSKVLGSKGDARSMTRRFSVHGETS